MVNPTAEKHLAKAKNYIAKGDEYYRKAKPEIEAAVAAGATHREVARNLARSHRWVQDVLAWDGKGTLYGKDTERRQIDQAKQVLREQPLEVVERIIGELPQERQAEVAAAAHDSYFEESRRQLEERRNRTPKEKREAKEWVNTVTQPIREMFGSMTATLIVEDLKEVAEELRKLIAGEGLTVEAVEAIDEALAEVQREFDFAKQMAGGE